MDSLLQYTRPCQIEYVFSCNGKIPFNNGSLKATHNNFSKKCYAILFCTNAKLDNRIFQESSV